MDSEPSSRSVAVVVDDPAPRSLLRAWLEADAWTVVELGTDALESAEAHEVVCLDLGPGEGGRPGTLERLGLLGSAPTVVVLVADSHQGVAAIRAGAYDAVARPLDRERLLVALSRAHERVTLLARARRAEAALSGGAPRPTGVALTAAAVRPLRELEREAITHALAACGGNVSRAAKLLGLGRATLYRRLAELEIP